MKFFFALFIINIICIAGYTQTEGYVASGTSKIYYRTYGSGKSIMIINGGPGLNNDGFVNLARPLSKNNATIIYDQRGTGKSTLQKSDSSTVTLQLMTDDLENLRRYLKIKRWIILVW